MRAIRHWVSVADRTGDAVWVSRDAPLVEPETIAVPYAPFPGSTAPREPGTVYSWIHNNLWDTNFPVEQGFELTFHYGVAVPTGDEPIEAVAVAATAALTRPLRGILASGADAGDAVALGAALLSLSDPRVQTISVVADGEDPSAAIVRLESKTSEPVELTLSFGFAPASAERSTLLGDPLGGLEVAGRDVTLALAPLETVGVRVRR